MFSKGTNTHAHMPYHGDDLFGCIGKDLIDNVCGTEGWNPVKEGDELVCKKTDEGVKVSTDKPWIGFWCSETKLTCPPAMIYQEDEHKCIPGNTEDIARVLKNVVDNAPDKAVNQAADQAADQAPGKNEIIPQFYH